MPAETKPRIYMLGTVTAQSFAWLGASYHRIAGLRIGAKLMLTLLTIGLVGYIDFLSGKELSFSIFYLLPIGYAAWFINARAGIFASFVCATIWFSIEVNYSPAYSHPLIPVWNAGVRLVFFTLGVGVVALVRRSEVHLEREVLLHTRIRREETERRHRLEREMLEMSAREQVRLAQDLHDGLGQYLSALAFHARILADNLREQGSPHTPQAERIMAVIRRTNQITRQLDRALRVPKSDEGGLFAALRALAAEFEQLSGVHCEAGANGEVPALDDFHTLMLFRIVQEAFNNAVKHSNPRIIRTSLGVVERMLIVEVCDDGQMLNDHSDPEFGSGMRIMKLRAELMGAHLTAGTLEGGGFRVECALPLSTLERDRVAES